MDKYVCDLCGYIYDPAEGDPDNGVAPVPPVRRGQGSVLQAVSLSPSLSARPTALPPDGRFFFFESFTQISFIQSTTLIIASYIYSRNFVNILF